MLTSLSLMLLCGLGVGFLFQKIKLPSIIGLLLIGILLGPFVCNVFDAKLLMISSELRKIALMIILLKAGFSLHLEDLKKVGKPALLLSFVPAFFEILAYIVLAPQLFEITWMDAALMGAVLSAVSPAVVVPRMLYYMESKWGTQKSIPQMILAGASLDDIFVLVLFSSFLGMAQTHQIDLTNFLNIPISMLLGIALGSLLGYALSFFLKSLNFTKASSTFMVQLMLVLGVALFLLALESEVKAFMSFSGLLALVSMANLLKRKSDAWLVQRFSECLGHLWLFFEIILFVLVGAAVDIRYTLEAGGQALILIMGALAIRTLGVLLCTLKSSLLWKERLFCVIAYLPKATVQAAIGSVPLALGLSSGKLILSVSVMAILITAPLGAVGMDYAYKFLLEQEQLSSEKTE